MNNEHERSIYGLRLLKNSHPDIRKLKQQTSKARLHGNKFWPSALLLIDYLSLMQPMPGIKVLEVGSGWGLSGIYCASHLAADVTALDADASVFPFLHYHAEINQVKLSTIELSSEALTEDQLSQFDALIASDICFWDEQAESLYDLIILSLEAGVGRIIISDPGREPFRRVAEHCMQTLSNVFYEAWSVPHPHNLSGFILDIVSHDDI